jgi:two-component system NtrC family sensor kinase
MRLIKNLLFFIVLLAVAQTSVAQPVVKFEDKTLSYDHYIGKSVDVFSDSTHKMTFSQVRGNPGLFIPSKRDVPSFGVANSSNWLRFKVVNCTDKNLFVLTISYPPIDEVELYVVNTADKTVKTVDSQYLLKRRHKHQFFIYNIYLNKGDTATCYLRVRSNKQLIVPMAISSGQDMVQFISKTDIFSGLYVGIMIVMILYNLFIYFSAKDKQYLFYVNYIFWVLMAQATLIGFTGRFIWTDPDSWFSRNMLSFFGAMSGIATIVFVKYFLQTKKYTHKLNTVLNLILLADIVSIIFLLLGFDIISYNIVNAIAGIGALTILITAIAIYPKTKKAATYFLVAWTVFLISVLIFVLKDVDVFSYNFFTVNSVQIGSSFEAILLSFALADRINTLKREKDQSRLAALRIAKENSQIIKQQNVVLEHKVKERTEELEQKNETLNVALNDLQEAQMQLVESEKMASLGQLTAGIAHEINNPINFVTGNIGPLKRDVSVLLEMIEMLEVSDDENIPKEEKAKKIQQYKDDMDFDYLKMEISHLLKGIHEGATRTAEIVKSLRIFSRLDEDDIKQADLNEGLESTLIIINNMLSKIHVVKDYADLPLVNCYPGKLNQVFLNIISNAVYAIHQKFDGEEGGEMVIKTNLSHNQVTISISDNGTGMTEETKRKMFDPFYTTKDVGQGTGLGMSIAFNTIQKHNGSIHVKTALGEGTTFTILIPIQELDS